MSVHRAAAMASRRPPPSYPESLCVALLGKTAQLKNAVGNRILHDETAFCSSNCLVEAQNQTFHVVNTSNFFDEACKHPDQQIIDFMAASYPGPDLFILVIDPDEVEEENVVAQIIKLVHIFGESVLPYLVVLLQDADSCNSLHHLMDQFNIVVAVNKENLASDCRNWCCNRRSFLYQYDDYSERVVNRRRKFLENSKGSKQNLTQEQLSSNEGASSQALPAHQTIGASAKEYTFVLLGLSGTGKSASGNTILRAGGSKTTSFFRSQASSMPVTRQCETRIVQYGIPVRVVDTPDFFSDQLPNAQQEIAKCREFCQSEPSTILLVFQLGRFSEQEATILDRLEKELGFRIRHRTIILLTHAEELDGKLGDYFTAHPPLYEMVRQCENRVHLFNNKSKDRKQVKLLLKKIPNYEFLFEEKTQRFEALRWLRANTP